MNRTVFQSFTIQNGLFSQNKGCEDISILTIFNSTQRILQVTVHRGPYGLCLKREPRSLPPLHPELHCREAPFGKRTAFSRGAKQRIHASYCWVVRNIRTLFQILQSILKYSRHIPIVKLFHDVDSVIMLEIRSCSAELFILAEL